MGLAAIASNAPDAGASVIELLIPVGLGIGSVFVAVAAAYLLAYINLVDAASPGLPALRRAIVATAIPVGLAFAGIVAFRALAILGYI